MKAFTLRDAENMLQDKLLPAFNNQVGVESSPLIEKMQQVILGLLKRCCGLMMRRTKWRR